MQEIGLPSYTSDYASVERHSADLTKFCLQY